MGNNEDTKVTLAMKEYQQDNLKKYEKEPTTSVIMRLAHFKG